MADDLKDESPLEEGLRDTELKEETHVRGSLGLPPTDDEEKVTPESDVFRNEPDKPERNGQR